MTGHFKNFLTWRAKTFQAELCTVGVPREPWDFVAQAVKAGHPRSMALHLNSEVTAMLREKFELSPHLVVKERAKFFSFWSKRSKELETEEKTLHDSLEPHLRQSATGQEAFGFQGDVRFLWIPRQNTGERHRYWVSLVGLVAEVTCFSS